MEYLIHIGILVCLYAILAVSLNLVVGYTGLLSVSHAAFYGIGAYCVAILVATYNLNFFVAAGGGVILAGALAGLMGLLLSKFSGDYYALVSMGFSVIVFSVLLNWQSLTRGSFGIPGIMRPSIPLVNMNTNAIYLGFCLLVLGVVYIVSRRIVHSSYGRILKTIREDERAVRVFGYKTFHYKLSVYIISAMFAATAGALFAPYITFVDPGSFSVNESIVMLSMIILGGLANLQASVLGALVLVVLPEVLRFVGFPSDIAAQMRGVVYGLTLVLLMLYKPQGLLGEYKF